MPLFREQFMIVVPPNHPLAWLRTPSAPAISSGGRYLNRISCEFYGYAGAIWRENGFEGCEMVYRSERDDWILAMVACRAWLRLHAGEAASATRGWSLDP